MTMMSSASHVFDLGPVKIAGASVLIFMLGFAAGNSHKTNEALKGQAVYFQKHEQQHVLVQKKIDEKVLPEKTRAEDAAAVGVPVPVLKATVDAAKASPAN